MGNLRTIRKRVRSVKSTQKITKAMKMVSAARLRRAQKAVIEAMPYAERIGELIEDLRRGAPEGLHPLLVHRPVQKRALIVLTSDRGLCGSFNASVIRSTEQELKGDLATTLVLIGRKGITYFGRREYEIFKSAKEFWPEFSFQHASALLGELEAGFESGAFDRVDVLYNQFVSVITQKPTVVPLLPLSPVKDSGEAAVAYEYEPNREDILKNLIPKAVRVRFFTACLHSLASEFGARMTAMDAATRNAGDMIDRLTLKMNRERQAAITRDLMDIIGGAEALR